MATGSGLRVTRAGIIFIAVTLLLAGILIGGSYLLRERGETVRQQEAAEIARQNAEENQDRPGVIAREEPEETPAPTESEAPAAPAVPETLPETGPSSLLAVIALALSAFGVTHLLQVVRNRAQG